MPQSLILTGGKLASFVSDLIPHYDHVLENVSIDGSISFQYSTKNGPVFVSTTLINCVKTTRSFRAESSVLNIECNPNYPGTNNIKRLKLFVFDSKDCQICMELTDGSQLASIDYPEAKNRFHTSIDNIMIRTV